MTAKDSKHIFTWHEDYSQLFQKCNWYDFTFIEISFENDKVMDGFEAVFMFLGLGFRWYWNYSMTKDRQYCVDAIAEITSGKMTNYRALNGVMAELDLEDEDGE